MPNNFKPIDLNQVKIYPLIENFTTVNMDFIRQYRPLTNVVKRPTTKGGQGFNLTGHHEIMLPLIAAGIIEQIS